MSENKKPRIAEILGVEVGEAFSIDGYPTDYGMVQVCEDGKIRRRCPKEIREVTQLEVGHKIGSNALYYLLNHPERIIRKPRFTEQEVADAKTLCRMWPNGEIKFTRATDGDCTMVQVQGSLRGCLGLGTVDLFPSIKPGQSYILNEIAGGNA